MTRHPGPFQGVGVYLTSEVHSATSGGAFNPMMLVQALADILGYQQRIIEEAGGIVEQFVGDCIIAFWPPADLNLVLPRVSGAVQRIIREKATVRNLEYRLSIQFCAAELAGAFFGSKTAFRFQVIGRARSRAEALPRRIPGRDCAFTDADTVAAMPTEIRADYQHFNSAAYVLKLVA